MATSQKTVDYILDQISSLGTVSAKKMFGEYGVYCDNKIVALICDDRLFVKPTEKGRAFIGAIVEAPPYPGAKPSFLVDSESWNDREYLSKLIKLTAEELSPPKPKPAKKVKPLKAKSS